VGACSKRDPGLRRDDIVFRERRPVMAAQADESLRYNHRLVIAA
jgi:hypothetical protein